VVLATKHDAVVGFVLFVRSRQFSRTHVLIIQQAANTRQESS
jgi:hypothetical protein